MIKIGYQLLNSNRLIEENIKSLIKILEELKDHKEPIENLFKIALKVIKKNKKIIFCGNGGSAAEAQHFATELVVRFKKNRKALPSLSLTTDTSAITAIGNDFSFNKIFSRQLEALGNKGDLLILLSTSGNSKNLIEAVKSANKNKIQTFSLIGKGGGYLKKISENYIVINSNDTARIQEVQLMIGHLLCNYLERMYQTSKL